MFKNGFTYLSPSAFLTSPMFSVCTSTMKIKVEIIKVEIIKTKESGERMTVVTRSGMSHNKTIKRSSSLVT